MNVQIKYNGQDITTSVLSYQRDKVICSGIGVCRVDVKGTLNLGSAIIYKEIVIYEEGIKKGTYYIHTVDRAVADNVISLFCQDASLKLETYFIPQNYHVAEPSYSKYWINKFVTEATVNVDFDLNSNGSLLPNDSDFGMCNVFDAITPMLQSSGWYLIFDKDNNCHIGTLQVDKTSPKYTFTDNIVLSIKRTKHDKMYRNRFVVWGSGNPSTQRWAFSNLDEHGKSSNEYPGGNDVRTIVVSNNNIKLSSEANIIAYKLKKEFKQLNDETEISLAGAFDLEVGNFIKLNSSYERAEGIVTSLSVAMSSSGLITTIIINQRCPRLFAWYDYGGWIYVGTHGSGVWRKPLKYNHTWENFSQGLTDLQIPDLAVQNGVFGCVSSDGNLFTRFVDTNWTQVYLSPQEVFSGEVSSGTLSGIVGVPLSGFYSPSEVLSTSVSINKESEAVVAAVTTTGEVHRGWLYYLNSNVPYKIQPFVDTQGRYEYTLKSVDSDVSGDIFVTARLYEKGAEPPIFNAGNIISSTNSYYGPQSTLEYLKKGYTVLSSVGTGLITSPNIIGDSNGTYRGRYDNINNNSDKNVKTTSGTFLVRLLNGELTATNGVDTYSMGQDAYSCIHAVFVLKEKVPYLLVFYVNNGSTIYCKGLNLETRSVSNLGVIEIPCPYYSYNVIGGNYSVIAVGKEKLAFTISSYVDSGLYPDYTSSYSEVVTYNIKYGYFSYSTFPLSSFTGANLLSLAGTSSIIMDSNDIPYVLYYLEYYISLNPIGYEYVIYSCSGEVMQAGARFLDLGAYSKTVASKASSFFIMYSGDTTFLVDKAGIIVKTINKTHSKIVICSNYTKEGEFLYYDGETGNIVGESITINTGTAILSGLNSSHQIRDSVLALVYDTLHLFVQERDIFNEYPASTFTYIATPTERIPFPEVGGITGEKDLVLKGREDSTAFEEVLEIAPLLDLEINHVDGVAVFGGISYSGIVVGNVQTGYNQGALWISNNGDPYTFTGVALDATRSYVSDLRLVGMVGSGLISSGVMLSGESDIRKYIMFTQANAQILEQTTSTDLLMVDFSSLTEQAEVINISGTYETRDSVYHTFDGYANHVEASNNGDIPYMFVSISGAIPVFWQKDSRNYLETETEFIDRTNNLPHSTILCIRCDDSIEVFKDSIVTSGLDL